MVQAEGMRGVVAGQSSITSIDGERGELRYRGYAIGDLAEHASFEQVAYLLWHGDVPTPRELQALWSELREARERYASIADLTRSIPTSAHPLDVLRYGLSRDALFNSLVTDNSPAANYRKAVEFMAWFPILAAAFHRARRSKEPVAPDPELDTAANFLFMLHGTRPSPTAARTLDISFILHAEHELNASTFAARVTIATQSNLHAAIASALATLAGPRHGGASDRVIQMLQEIGTPERAEAWTRDTLKRHERVMGFGHPVYRTVDPRSRHLRAMAEQLLAGTEHDSWIAVLDIVADVMKRERDLYPNVDLYAALVNHELGIDPAFYTSVFACSRIVGWTAHAIEQLDGRLIRPVAEYVGPGPRSMGPVPAQA